MRTPLEPRRPTVSLTVASPSEPATPDHSRIPYVPWLLAALAWTAAVAASGWVVVGALVSVSWITAPHVPAAEVLNAIGQGWLALHGVPVVLGGATLRMLPLGLTLLLVVGCAFAAHHAAGQYRMPEPAGGRQHALAWASVVAACVGSYVLVGGVLAVVVGTPAQFGQAVPGLVAVPLLGAGIGAVLGLGVDLLAGRPDWLRRLPRAAGLGSAVIGLGALAALVVALVAHWPRVVALHEGLEPDAVGAVVLTLVQLAYLPNLLAWSASFVLGAGVDLGVGGSVAPGAVDPVLLPAVPVLGAVPSTPTTNQAQSPAPPSGCPDCGRGRSPGWRRACCGRWPRGSRAATWAPTCWWGSARGTPTCCCGGPCRSRLRVRCGVWGVPCGWPDGQPRRRWRSPLQ